MGATKYLGGMWMASLIVANAVSCAGDECVPYDDDCPSNQYCQYTDDRLECVAAASVGFDGNSPGECVDDACARGRICMPASLTSPFHGDRSLCYQPCDHRAPREDNGCSNRRHTCHVARSEDGVELDFGVCDH